MCQLLPRFLEKKARGQVIQWQTVELADIFHYSIEHLINSDVEILIDALDECSDNEVFEVVQRFESSVQMMKPDTNLRVCWSSRFYPHISLRAAEGIELVMNEKNAVDIQRYVFDLLPMGSQVMLRPVFLEIISRSNGIFLWASLVTDRLLKAFNAGSTPTELQETVLLIPDNLEDLFSTILGAPGYTAEQKTYLQRMALFVLGSFRPLTIQELHTALLLERPSIQGSIRVDRLSPAEVEQFTKRIIHASGGLIEVIVREKPRTATGDAKINDGCDPSLEWDVESPFGEDPYDITQADLPSKTTTVQVIHESVRGFFLGKGVSFLNADSETSLSRHCQSTITNACFNGLIQVSNLTTERRDEANKERPLNDPIAQRLLPQNPASFPDDPFLMEYIRDYTFAHLRSLLSLLNDRSESGLFLPSIRARHDALYTCLRICSLEATRHGGLKNATNRHLAMVLRHQGMIDQDLEGFADLLDHPNRLAACSEFLRRRGIFLSCDSPRERGPTEYMYQFIAIFYINGSESGASGSTELSFRQKDLPSLDTLKLPDSLAKSDNAADKYLVGMELTVSEVMARRLVIPNRFLLPSRVSSSKGGTFQPVDIDEWHFLTQYELCSLPGAASEKIKTWDQGYLTFSRPRDISCDLFFAEPDGESPLTYFAKNIDRWSPRFKPHYIRVDEGRETLWQRLEHEEARHILMKPLPHPSELRRGSRESFVHEWRF